MNNLFFTVRVSLVILQHFHLLLYIRKALAGFPTKAYTIKKFYTITYNFIGYAFFIISIVLKIYIMVHTENNSSKTYSLRITKNKPNYLLILCKIVIIIFSLICLLISSVITLLAVINTNNIPL